MEDENWDNNDKLSHIMREGMKATETELPELTENISDFWRFAPFRNECYSKRLWSKIEDKFLIFLHHAKIYWKNVFMSKWIFSARAMTYLLLYTGRRCAVSEIRDPVKKDRGVL